MRQFIFPILAIFGGSFCSSTSGAAKNQLPGTKPAVPQIDNTLELAQENSLHYEQVLPPETWNYLTNFLDLETEKRFVQVCKKFYVLSNKTLHQKMVQEWMNARSNNGNLLQNHCFFDPRNSYFEIFNSLEEEEISLQQKETLRHVLRFTSILKLPNLSSLDMFLDGNRVITQLPNIKELTVIGNSENDGTFGSFYFQIIQSIFTNLDILHLDLNLDESAKIPFTADDVFLSMRNLKRLSIRIVNSDGELKTRQELASFLEILKEERITLKIETGLMAFESTAALAFEILGNELKGSDEQYRMKERLYLNFSGRCDQQTPQNVSDNASQIHSLHYFAYGKKASVREIFSEISKFRNLETLSIQFQDMVIGPEINQIKPFSKLSNLSVLANDQHLLSSLHVLFPNISQLRITGSALFDHWFASFIRLRNLEKVRLVVQVTRLEYYDILNAINKEQFPNLREIRLPYLAYNYVPGKTLQDAVIECMERNPFVKFENLPVGF